MFPSNLEVLQVFTEIRSSYNNFTNSTSNLDILTGRDPPHAAPGRVVDVIQISRQATDPRLAAVPHRQRPGLDLRPIRVRRADLDDRPRERVGPQKARRAGAVRP